jgi:hypothetical protein
MNTTSKQISIAKGLKIKNRLIGEINRVKGIIIRENSSREDNPSKVDTNDVYSLLCELRSQLVELKSKLAIASAPAAGLLAELTELKDFINFLPTVPAKDHIDYISVGGGAQPMQKKWQCAIDRNSLELYSARTQERINELQDELDSFNAKTTFEYNY